MIELGIFYLKLYANFRRKYYFCMKNFQEKTDFKIQIL